MTRARLGREPAAAGRPPGSRSTLENRASGAARHCCSPCVALRLVRDNENRRRRGDQDDRARTRPGVTALYPVDGRRPRPASVHLCGERGGRGRTPPPNNATSAMPIVAVSLGAIARSESSRRSVSPSLLIARRSAWTTRCDQRSGRRCTLLRFALDAGFARVESDGSRLEVSQALAARS